MITVKIKQIFLQTVTREFWRLIDPTSYRIEKFAISLKDDISSGAYVLDAGAGETPYKKYFHKQNYIAIDTQWGDPDWDYSNLNIIGDLAQLPFPNNTFDGIIFTQVLEHIREPYHVIAELFRVMKPGGTLRLSAPQGWGVHQAPHDYFRYTHYGLKYLLEKGGFRLISSIPTCGYFGYLANRLTVFPKTMFWEIRSKILRLLFVPLEILSYIFFVLVFPLLLNSIDFLDSKQNYTLNYMITATKDE